MTKRQVLILWSIALLLAAAVFAVKARQRHATDTTTRRAPGQTLFETFPGNDIATIQLTGVGTTTTLAKKDGTWTVTERGGYPAKSTTVNTFLRTLADLQVTRGMEAGPSLAPRFGMDPAATTPADRGLTALFKDAAGKEIAALTLGKNVSTGATADPVMGGAANGRFIRNHADTSGFYAISELFPEIIAEPAAWLDPAFFTLEKLHTLTVTHPGKDDIDWGVTRADETADFTPLHPAPGDAVKPDKAPTLKTLLSYITFTDVLPAENVKDRLLPETTRKITLTTFEGFTYHLTLSSAKPAPAADPAKETVLLTVSVTADLPKARKKAAEEKPEDAQKLDAAFTSRLATLTAKLAAEQKLAPYTYEIEKSAVEILLLPRAEVIPAFTTPPATAPATP